ncbi:MAG: hypothetical protein ACXAC8_13640 [Candidatus Hodarchaeales archaeon]|jgi:hypothetical protein
MKSRLIYGAFLVLLVLGMLNIMPGITMLGDDLYEDFESGLLPWEATGLWHIENNAESQFQMDWIPSEKHYAWYGDNRTGTYQTFDVNGTETSNSGDLISENVNTASLSGQVVLSFWSYADTEPGDMYDKKEIYISTDDGLNWTLIGVSFPHVSWQWYALDLTPYIGGSLRIRFHFETGDEVTNDIRGWLIDDIKIEQGLPHYPEFFNLFIHQENYAQVNETWMMDFSAYSYFYHGMNVSIVISIVGPSGEDILYQNDSVFIAAHEVWNTYIEYNFSEPGNYDVYFSLKDDESVVWETTCWWKVADGDLLLYIEQDLEADVGKPEELFFNIHSFLETSTNIAAEVTIIGSNSSEIIFSNPNIFLDPSGDWGIPLVHTFAYPGYYDVYFEVRDNINGTYFSAWCSFEVWEIILPEQYLEVHINQEYYAKVGEKKFIEFVVKSQFTHDKFVDIEAIMETPSGNFLSFFDTSATILPNGDWTSSASFLFEEIGLHKVFLEVTDETGTTWMDDCWWEISKDDTISENTTSSSATEDKNTTSSTTTEDNTTISLTPGFELFIIPVIFAVIVTLRKKRR